MYVKGKKSIIIFHKLVPGFQAKSIYFVGPGCYTDDPAYNLDS